jgi:hypothetical protein
MKLRNTLSGAALVVGALAWCSPASAAEVLYNQTGFVSGQESFAVPLNISGPGTLTITLSNVAWPDSLASLDMVVGTASGLMGTEMGAGTETFNVTGGQMFAQWFGKAQGPLNLGVYSLDVVFQPSGETVVPLPASIVLLVSGLALLGWQRRPRSTS